MMMMTDNERVSDRQDEQTSKHSVSLSVSFAAWSWFCREQILFLTSPEVNVFSFLFLSLGTTCDRDMETDDDNQLPANGRLDYFLEKKKTFYSCDCVQSILICWAADGTLSLASGGHSLPFVSLHPACPSTPHPNPFLFFLLLLENVMAERSWRNRKPNWRLTLMSVSWEGRSGSWFAGINSLLQVLWKEGRFYSRKLGRLTPC